MQLKLLSAVKYNVECWIRYENKGHKHKVLWNLNKILTLVNDTISHVKLLIFYNIVFLYILGIVLEVSSLIQKTSF